MEDKVRDLEEETRIKVFRLEQERLEQEQEVMRLRQMVKELEEDERQQLSHQKNQFEKQIDKLSFKFENEVTGKMQEAESQFRDMERNL